MKARLLLTGALLAVSAGALSGCVVYGHPAGYVEAEPSIVVRPAPYYYGYGPPRYYYDRRPYRRW